MDNERYMPYATKVHCTKNLISSCLPMHVANIMQIHVQVCTQYGKCHMLHRILYRDKYVFASYICYTGKNEQFIFSFMQPLRPVSTSANLVARTGTVACSGIEMKQSDWFSLILVAKKLHLIQLLELTARSPVNARFKLGFRAAHALIAHRLVARPNSPKWKPAFKALM